jgi:hypothetical protein
VGPSELFKKYYTYEYTLYLGRVNRFVSYKDKSIVNYSFLNFLKQNNIQRPQGYRMVKANLDAGFKNCCKYNRAQPDVNEELWNIADGWTRNHFGPYLRGSKVLEKETVIKEMDAATSCGYPWSQKFHTKKEFFDSPSAKVLDFYWDELATFDGIRPIYRPIWTCAEKVELRSSEKLDENKIRTFTASPIEHSVTNNRLFLDMNNRFYNSHDSTWSFVGGNKFMQGWNRLYARLSKHPNSAEFDVSSHDFSCFKRCMMDIARMRYDFLRESDKTPENYNRTMGVYESIVNSVIVLENGELIMKNTGNPSGCTSTVVDNTFCLFKWFAYTWLVLVARYFGTSNVKTRDNANCVDLANRIYDKPIFGGYIDYMTHVECALFGDDNTNSVSDEVKAWYSIDNICEVMATLGVKITSEHKTYVPLKQLSFLSQSFAEHKSCMLPCPETNKVLCSLLYASAYDDVRWHLLRANALLLNSWANLELRRTIREYIQYLCLVHRAELCGVINDIKVIEIMAQIKDDSWYEKLYIGLESKNEQIERVEKSLLNFIYSFNDERLL